MVEGSGRTGHVRLSIVVPCHNEARNIEPLFRRLDAALASTPHIQAELIFVDDGSTDATLELLTARARQDPRLQVLELSRNFGKEAALTAGLDAATGDAVIPMDADLQHPPELIGALVERWRAGSDVVLARRNSRTELSVLQRWATVSFYRLYNRLAKQPMPVDAGDFRLMDRCVIDALKRLPERQRLMKGLYAWIGFRTAEVGFDVEPRREGRSRFGWARLIGLALDGLLSFSTLPLRVWTYIGTTVAAGALVYGFWIVLKTLLWGVEVPGFASLLTAVLFIGGIQLLSVGVLGEYLGRVYEEAKARPIYIVRRRHATRSRDGSA